MWLIKVGDKTVESDDFTIGDLEEIEKATATPWSIANPLRDIKVARAFLATAMLREGVADREVEQALRTITLRSLKNTFAFKPDDEDEPEVRSEEDDPLDRPARTSRASSRGRATKGGSRARPDENVSEMSSAS